MPTLTIASQDGSHWASNPNRTAWETIWTSVTSVLCANLQPVRNITVTIDRDYGFVNGTPISGNGSASRWYIETLNYSDIRTAFLALPPNSYQSTAFTASVPSSNPLATVTSWWVTQALCRAIGADPTNPSLDGYVGFSSGAGAFDLTPDGTGTSTGPGSNSLWGAMLHEITEVLGRNSGLNQDPSAVGMPVDLFTYSAAGTRNFSQSGARYVSPDGGTTDLIDLYAATNGDFSDTTDANPFNAFVSGSAGVTPNPVFQRNWRYMTLIGWPLTGTGLSNAGLDLNSAAGVVATSSTVIGTSAADKASPGSISTSSTVLGVGNFTTTARGSTQLGR